MLRKIISRVNIDCRIRLHPALRCLIRSSVLVTAAFVVISPARFVLAETNSSQPPVVLAVVNGDSIMSTDLDGEIVRLHSRLDAEKMKDFNYRNLFNRMINDRLLVQEARAMGMDEEPWLVDMLEENRRSDAIRLYVSEKFTPDLTVTDNEILQYFDKNYARMQIRTVSVANKELAGQLADSIRGGASMDGIAQEMSIDSYRYKGGLHNLKYLADVESIFRDIALALPPGKVSEPFPYRQAYAILRVEKSLVADTADLQKVRAKVVAVIAAGKRQTAWRAFLDSLSAIYPPRVDSQALAALYRDSAKLYTPDFTTGTEGVVVSIDTGQVYRDAQLRTLISRAAMEAGNQPFGAIVDSSLKVAEEELVLAAAAAHDGYGDRETIKKLSRKSLDSALVEVYIKENIIPRITFNRAEFKQYYDDHPDDFREPETYQLDRIQVKEDSIAQEIVRRLNEGADFEFLAREFNAETAKGEEKTAWVSLATFPESIAGEISELKTGGFSRPFATADGWVIFQVLGKQPGRLKSLDEVEMDIRGVMFQKKFNQLLDETFALLKANSDIQIDQPAVDKYFEGEK
jgi:parvulin-like peptidyl-prolyl isomerase